MEISQKRFLVYLKPNRKENKFEGYNNLKNAYVISVKAPAQDNKANKELLLFLKKNGYSCTIKAGFSSRLKVMERK